jgi:hypothetical protein
MAVALPMEDSLMGPDQLMKFAPMALRKLATNRADYMNSPFGLSTIVAGIAKQAALGEDNFVGGVPGMMLATWIKAGSSSSEKFPKAQFLAPGKWTLVLCHERQTRAANDGYVIRYAFASMDKDKKSVIIGAPEFFPRFNKDDNEAVERLSAEWQHEMAGITLCHAEEVLEAMTLALSERG